MNRTQKQMKVISHKAHRIQLVWHLLLGFSKHSYKHITPQAFSNQELTAIAPECDVKGVTCW